MNGRARTKLCRLAATLMESTGSASARPEWAFRTDGEKQQNIGKRRVVVVDKWGGP